jgi:UDP-N-acetyl-2-amino-2-deoxyglucuronate dehydrogenase
MTPVKVGFIGTGHIARFHLLMVQISSTPAEIVAVHDADADRAAAFAADAGAEVVDSAQAVCERADAVFVCTWTAAHHDAVAAAVAQGRAVLCEKPLATDLDRAKALTDLVTEAGVINQVGLVLRRSPAFNLVRQLLADPRAGRPMATVFRDDQYIPVQGMYRSDWRGDVAKAGAGTLLEHSIHDVDILTWLLGPIDKVSAWSRSFHEIEGIEDTVTASLSFASGAVGSLVSVWHDVIERPSQRHVEVLCERLHVTIEGDWFGPVRWTFTGEPEQVLENDALLAAIDPPLFDGGNPDSAFLAAVTEDRPSSPDVEDALRAHRVVDALYRSAAADGTPMTP